jgi:GNAT superfamily N-acetyltransferase
VGSSLLIPRALAGTTPILPSLSFDWLLSTVRREQSCQPKSSASRMEHEHDPLFQLETVVNDLPAGFDALRAEARAEGYLFVERLFTEWMSHINRFDREGEMLLAARLDGVLAGIGGITIEPVKPGALRMRRFYVCSAFRRNGVGDRLAKALLNRVRVGRPITVNAAPASFAFWESVGFRPDHRDGHTHILVR